MSIQLEVTNQWKEALKANNPSKNTLSLIRAEFKNKLISGRTEVGADKLNLDSLSDEQAIQVLSRMSKQRRESILDFKKANRDDLVENETLELKVIETFMPQQMTEEQIGALVKETALTVDAVSQKDIGKLMKALSPLVKGKADGTLVQKKVKEFLV